TQFTGDRTGIERFRPMRRRRWTIGGGYNSRTGGRGTLPTAARRRRGADFPHGLAITQGELMRTALRRTALMLVCVVAAPLSAQSITPGAPAIAPVWMPTPSSTSTDSTARPAPQTASDATRAGVHRPDLARPDQPTSL